MALDAVIDSNQLNKEIKSVADTIRAKTGRNEEMEWPEGLNKNINSITGNGAQPDWLENDEYSPAYIRNKPDAATKEELQNIVNGAPEAFDTLKEVSDWINKNNKQADWNQSDETAVDYVKNRPKINKGTGKNAEVFNGITSANAVGEASHAEGSSTTASEYASHAEGAETTASGLYSHAEGYRTTASSRSQHVEGENNYIDSQNKYLHITGNGSACGCSNAYTLDWHGNGWYENSVLVGGGNMDTPEAELTSKSIIISSSTPGSIKRFKITVDDSGAIKAEEVVK